MGKEGGRNNTFTHVLHVMGNSEPNSDARNIKDNQETVELYSFLINTVSEKALL